MPSRTAIGYNDKYPGEGNSYIKRAGGVLEGNFENNPKGVYYRKIHYLTREFRVKLHAKTDIARIAKR